MEAISSYEKCLALDSDNRNAGEGGLGVEEGQWEWAGDTPNLQLGNQACRSLPRDETELHQACWSCRDGTRTLSQ